MKTTIFNKTYNVALTIDSEQFITVGTALDMYILSNSKLRTIDNISPAVFDIQSSKWGDMPRVFIIETDATGDWAFTGGDAGDFGDSTNIPYALYDATTFAFAGFYNLAAAGTLTYLIGEDSVANDSTYIAMPMSDVPLSLIDGAVKARAAYTAIMAKGVANVMTISEVDDTVNKNVGVLVQANQYTTDIEQQKLVVLPAKYQKRLQFPFHTAFEGTWYDVGTSVSKSFALDSETVYILVFFKDVYGNVSFPQIYVVNP